MRALLKFLHSLGAAGMLGGCASLLAMMTLLPRDPPLADYAARYQAMAVIVTYVFFPSFLLTIAAGLLAVAINRSFHNAGWAWVKLATGVLIFEAGMAYLIGPIQAEAKRAAAALAGELDPARLTGSYGAERGTLWFMVAISVINIALGVWRPRLTRIPD